MVTKEVSSNTWKFLQLLKTCASLSNLSQKQKTAKTNTAVSKSDAFKKLIMDMAHILEDALPTSLSHCKDKLFGKRKIILTGVKVPNIPQCMLGCHHTCLSAAKHA